MCDQEDVQKTCRSGAEELDVLSFPSLATRPNSNDTNLHTIDFFADFLYAIVYKNGCFTLFMSLSFLFRYSFASAISTIINYCILFIKLNMFPHFLTTNIGQQKSIDFSMTHYQFLPSDNVGQFLLIVCHRF